MEKGHGSPRCVMSCQSHCLMLQSQERQVTTSGPQIHGQLTTGLVEKALNDLTRHLASFVLWMTCGGLRDASSMSEQSRESRHRGGEAWPGHFNTLLVSLPIQGGAFRSRATRRCLEIKKNAAGFYEPVRQACGTQVWSIQHTVRNWGSH